MLEALLVRADVADLFMRVLPLGVVQWKLAFKSEVGRGEVILRLLRMTKIHCELLIILVGDPIEDARMRLRMGRSRRKARVRVVSLDHPLQLV